MSATGDADFDRLQDQMFKDAATHSRRYAHSILERRAVCPACKKPWADCRCALYCAECECWSNHTTMMHRAAMAGCLEEP